VGAPTRRYALTILQSCLQRAVEWGRIPDNPVRKLRKPTAKRTRSVRPLPPDDIESIRRSLRGTDRHRDATLVTTLAYAGLRPGEALALRWRDVRKNTLLVERANSDGELKSTKTGKVRTVRLLAPLADDLADLRRRADANRDGDLVFPSTTGVLWTTDDWKNWTNRTFRPDANASAWASTRARQTATAAGADPTATPKAQRPYDLRHSFVSLLIHEGLSVVEVASQAGHAPSMTLDTYAHTFAEFDPDDRSPAADRIYEAREPQLRGSYVSGPPASLEKDFESGKYLQITESRCADSNRGPLHYECVWDVFSECTLVCLYL
jgi:integrase